MAEELTPKFELSVGGKKVGPEIVDEVILIRVRQHLEMADVIEVKLTNDEFLWTDSDAFADGKAMSVKLGYQETGLVQVAAGEIVRRECEFPQRGPAVVTVVAYDREHRLKRGRRSRSWADENGQLKDSDIIEKLAKEAGLSADVETTDVKHFYLFQNAQTNLAFIRERARLLGFEVDVDPENAKVTFKKPARKRTGAKLKWGESLTHFTPRMTTDEQVSEVKVRGWDMTQKRPIEATADKRDVRYTMDGTKKGSELAEKTFKKRTVLYTDRPTFADPEAVALAEARLNDHARRYVEGEGGCTGNPKVVVGVTVEIEGCGARSNGQYFVAQTIHHIEPGIGYTTHFGFARSTELKPR